jgi:hypothetical protein
MSLSLRKKAAASALAVAAGGGVAAALPASPAVAYYSPPLFLDITVGDPGRLLARGSAVEVPVEVTCNPGATAYVWLSVTQTVGNKIAKSDGYATVGCTGAHQVVLVTAVAGSGQAFRIGKALAEGEVFACLPDVCGWERDQRTIALTR